MGRLTNLRSLNLSGNAALAAALQQDSLYGDDEKKMQHRLQQIVEGECVWD